MMGCMPQPEIAPEPQEEISSTLRREVPDDELTRTWAGPAGSDRALRAGQRVGPYEILGLLGQGGMGRVYRARRSDGHFDREVAVKVIRDGLAGQAMVACFVRERQILADLDHPGIARLLDGGATDDGRPFLVMELIEGELLSTHCDRLGLGVEARLHLMLGICEAVAYAHRRLVVHRDLKPGNILVDNEGRPRLLDFGTAKLLDDAQSEVGVTTTPSTVGGNATPSTVGGNATPSTVGGNATPSTVGGNADVPTARQWCSPDYASPEQMSGDSISTATDIYALGAVLYTLLTGRSPHRFTSRNPVAMARVVIEETVELPSRVVADDHPSTARRLRGDLDTIVATAMAKKPERRYPSVEALAEDLRRHLDQRPIRARRPTLGYRFDRFLHRHWRGLGVALMLTVATVAGALAYVAQARETARERDRAEVERARSQQVADLLAEMFEDFDPDLSPGQGLEIRQRLDRNARRIDEVASEPEVRAALLHTLGVAYGKLGEYVKADQALSEAVRLRRRELGLDHLDTASSLRHLSLVAADNGQWARGAALQRLALDIRRRLLPENDPRIAQSLLDSAESAARLDDAVAAVDMAQRAVSILEGRVPDDDLRLAQAWLQLGSCKVIVGELEQGEALMAKALKVRAQQLGPEHSDVAEVHLEMAIAAIRLGNIPESGRRLEAARGSFEKVLGADHPRSVQTALELSMTYLRLGQCGESRSLLQRALEAGHKAFREQHPLIGLAHQYLGIARFNCGSPQEAREPLEHAVSIFEAELGADHFRTASALFYLAMAQRVEADYGQAEISLRRSHAIRQVYYGAEHAVHGLTLREMARLERAQGRWDTSETLLRQALHIQIRELGELHFESVNSSTELDGLIFRRGRTDEALDHLRDLQRQLADSYGEQHTLTTGVTQLLARLQEVCAREKSHCS